MAITLDGSNLTTSGVINRGTAVASTSGTSIDFTGIPIGATRITIMFNGVSANAVSQSYMVQIGDGSINTTGYLSNSSFVGATTGGLNFVTGFGVVHAVSAAEVFSGTITLTTLGSNIWVASVTCALTNVAFSYVGAGNKTLSGTLDRVRITTLAGTATFDAGSINILYE